MRWFLRCIGCSIVVAWAMPIVGAVPPPDFLFTAWAQVAQAFSILAIVLSSALVGLRQYIRAYCATRTHRILFWTIAGGAVIIISLAGGYWYATSYPTL